MSNLIKERTKIKTNRKNPKTSKKTFKFAMTKTSSTPKNRAKTTVKRETVATKRTTRAITIEEITTRERRSGRSTIHEIRKTKGKRNPKWKRMLTGLR